VLYSSRPIDQSCQPILGNIISKQESVTGNLIMLYIHTLVGGVVFTVQVFELAWFVAGKIWWEK